MHPYTAITSEKPTLPAHLALLTAPVFFSAGRGAALAGPPAARAGGELAGNLRGAVVDPRGHVVLFIFEPLLDSFPLGERILVPLAGLEFGGSVGPEKAGEVCPIVRLLWDEDQLHGQPRLTGAAIQPKDKLATPVPPSPGGSGEKAVRDALYSGAVSGAAGAVLGLALGGLPALSLGLFFAAGGGIAGAITGASTEPAADAAHLVPPDADATTGNWQVRELEAALKDRALYEQGVLRATPIAVVNPSEPMPREGSRAKADTLSRG
jgi:hypothetical protein